MRFTNEELGAINDALAELLAGEGPQGVDDEHEVQRVMTAAHAAQAKIQVEIAKREGRK